MVGQLRTIAPTTDIDEAALIGSHLHAVSLRPGTLEIELRSGDLIRLPWSPTSGHRRREIIVPAGRANTRPARSEDRARILLAIARGRRWMDELTSGAMPDPDAIAAREGQTERSIRTILSLASLSPSVVATITEGRLPRGIGIARLAELSPTWAEQHHALGM